MEKVILDKSSYVNKNEETIFVYTLVKPKYNKTTKKFEGYEFFEVRSKNEYQLLDIVNIEYNKTSQFYEITDLVFSTNFVEDEE